MRVALFLIGCLCALFFSPVLTALCIVALALVYDAWEAILLGFMMDLMWQTSALSLDTLPYFTIGAIVIVWAFAPLRAQFLR